MRRQYVGETSSKLARKYRVERYPKTDEKKASRQIHNSKRTVMQGS